MQVTYFLSLESHREPADPFFLPSRPLFSLTDLAVTASRARIAPKYLQGQVTCDVNAPAARPEQPRRPLRSWASCGAIFTCSVWKRAC